MRYHALQIPQDFGRRNPQRSHASFPQPPIANRIPRRPIAVALRRLLKAELARRGITYAQLVGKLADIGVMDSEPNIRNKISRGKFTAVFLLQCLEAIGASSLRLSDG